MNLRKILLLIAATIFAWLKKWTEWRLVKVYEIREAVSNRDHKRLKILLKFANINAINWKDLGGSALDLAARMGDNIAVDLLLAHGAIPDYNRPLHVWSQSTLSRAIIGGNHTVIQLLLNRGGCDLEATFAVTSWREILVSTSPYNYWFKVVQLNDLPIFQLLLEITGQEVGDDNAWSQRMLLTACGLGSDAIVEYLLDQGISVETTDESCSWTCAFFAVAYNKIFTVELLISRGANLKHTDFKGRNLLHIAVLHSITFGNIVQMLIDNGTDINAIDNNGLTPICTVFTLKNLLPWVFDHLLHQREIDLAKPDFNGITIMHRAAKHHYFFSQIFCNHYEVDIDARDNLGRTPLHYYTKLSSLSYLLEFGLDSKALLSFRKDVLNNEVFLYFLDEIRLKRKVADLSNDPIIDTLLAQHRVDDDIMIEKIKDFELKLSNEIQNMKETLICNKLTFYDFLHAKKRACINIINEIPEMYETIMYNKFNFKYYVKMLIKNYVFGKRPLTTFESQAMTSVEENLDVLFNHKLPSLIIHNLKKYIDIEDMVTLENMNLFHLNVNASK